jgi:hypothetical protein
VDPLNIYIITLHSIFEFLPISSSFFLNQFLNTNKECQFFLHGICSIYTGLYFIKDYKSYFNMHLIFKKLLFLLVVFLLNSYQPIVTSAISILIYLIVISGYKLLKIQYGSIVRNKIFFSIILLILFFMGNIYNFKTSNIIYLISTIILLISLITSYKNTIDIRYNYYDSIILAQIVCVSNIMPISRLGSIITYGLFIGYKRTNAINDAFLLSGILNGALLIYNYVFQYNNEINYITNYLYALICAPVIILIIHFAIKQPTLFIVFSVIIRILFMFFYLPV